MCRLQVAVEPTLVAALMPQADLVVAAANGDVSWIFIELGAAVIGLAVLARLAHRFGFSAIPLYLLGGLAFGNGGLLPLHFSEDFVRVGAEIVLLLAVLGPVLARV